MKLTHWQQVLLDYLRENGATRTSEIGGLIRTSGTNSNAGTLAAAAVLKTLESRKLVARRFNFDRAWTEWRAI